MDYGVMAVERFVFDWANLHLHFGHGRFFFLGAIGEVAGPGAYKRGAQYVPSLRRRPCRVLRELCSVCTCMYSCIQSVYL
jgi:hypothetical protein